MNLPHLLGIRICSFRTANRTRRFGRKDPVNSVSSPKLALLRYADRTGKTDVDRSGAKRSLVMVDVCSFVGVGVRDGDGVVVVVVFVTRCCVKE